MIEAPPAKTLGVKPLTIVENSISITLEEMAARVVDTREQHGDLLQQYHDVWYNAPHTWHYLHFLGVGMMKCPNDLWMYQELMAATRPTAVIETGTYQGGSALWFAFLMDMLQIDGGRVFTIDFEDHRRAQHPRITFLGGDSRDPAIRDAIVEEIRSGELTCDRCGNGPAWLEAEGRGQVAGEECPVQGCAGILTARPAGPILISLDADHSADHVRRELEIYAPLTKVGDYIVVEDTNISWGAEHRVTFEHAIVGFNRPRSRWSCSCGVAWEHDGPVAAVGLPCPADDGKGDRGARGGIEDYIADHQGEFVQDVLCERWLLTMNPGGWLKRVAECSHD